MAEQEVKDFLKSLVDTQRLRKYIPGNFNFNIDPWDPVIVNVLLHLKEMKDNEKSNQGNDSNVEMVMFHGMTRHITTEVRFALYEKLSVLKDKVKGKEANLLKNALMGLEDNVIQPGLIGIVFDLYSDYLMNIIENLAPLAEIEIKDHDNLIQTINNFSSEKDLELLSANINLSLRIIEDELLSKNLTKEKLQHLLNIVFKLPCFHSASLLFHLYLENTISLNELLNHCNNKMKELISIYVLDTLENFESSLNDKWHCFSFLFGIKNERLIILLAEELSGINDYDEDQKLVYDYYMDIVQKLILLKDRRAVPAFIKFLGYAQQQGISAQIIAGVDRLLQKTVWYSEIQNGLQLLRKGERVFVKMGENSNSSVLEKWRKFSALQTKLTGVPPDEEEMNRFTKNEMERWNEAYHEDLDGLRPVDIPVSQVDLKMMKLMHESFFNKYRETLHSSQEAVKKLKEYQKEWMIIPLEHDINSTPLIQMLKDQEKKSTTLALKDHYKKYKTTTINSLYLQAAAEIENNEIEKGLKILEVLLAIEPAYPFAVHLKKKITKG